MSDENQNNDGATHGLHHTVASLHRSLKKAEQIIQQEAEDAGYSITHFEIDFPAQLQLGPDASRTKAAGGAENGGRTILEAAGDDREDDHAFLTLPKTKALKSKGPSDPKYGLEATADDVPESSIPEHHLSRLKIVLRKQINLAED